MGSTLAWPFRPSAAGRPRRILSIDGGGIRGLIPIEVLVELERQLAERSGRPDAVLADHFDLVAGTSAGALVAAAISIGRPMVQTRQFVVENAGRMFKAAAWHKRLWHLYDEGEFEARIKAFLGEHTHDVAAGAVIASQAGCGFATIDGRILTPAEFLAAHSF